MNYKAILRILGRILFVVGWLLLIPMVVALIYKESLRNVLAFVLPALFLIGIGFLLSLIKPTHKLYQRDGFALVGIAWIVIGLFGALPFVINGDIPSYHDAFFEIVSGFTTTGASILNDVEVLSHSSLFWRSFSHWIGGMGILVFVLIFIPESNEGESFNLLRAESPGPQVGKLVSKLRATSRILYLIYLVLTVVEVILLVLDPGFDLFESLTISFGSAGTGGFSIWNTMVEHTSAYSQYIIGTFMILFGVNFSLYYFILIGKFTQAIKSEELRSYFGFILTAVLIFTTVLLIKDSQQISLTFANIEGRFRESYFTVASIITTTGYSISSFNSYPTILKTILILLMLSGAMAGSTGGGIKVSRVVMGFKGFILQIRKIINPRYAGVVKMDGKVLEENQINNNFFYLSVYFFVLIVVVVILSFDPIWYDATNIYHDLETNLTATISCLSNIGPGLGMVDSYGNFSEYSVFSKIILALTMIIGRLEFYPVLILMDHQTWKLRFKN